MHFSLADERLLEIRLLNLGRLQGGKGYQQTARRVDVSRGTDVQAKTEKTSPLESDGAFMLGNEQDCYGGCTDSTQAFYGLMDEVSTSSHGTLDLRYLWRSGSPLARGLLGFAARLLTNSGSDMQIQSLFLSLVFAL